MTMITAIDEALASAISEDAKAQLNILRKQIDKRNHSRGISLKQKENGQTKAEILQQMIKNTDYTADAVFTSFTFSNKVTRQSIALLLSRMAKEGHLNKTITADDKIYSLI